MPSRVPRNEHHLVGAGLCALPCPSNAHHLVGEGLRALPCSLKRAPISTPPPCVGAGPFPVAGDAILIKGAKIDRTGQETCLKAGNIIVIAVRYLPAFLDPCQKRKNHRW